jgi:hypothetical protein
LEHTTALLGTKDSKIEKREKMQEFEETKSEKPWYPKHIGMEFLGCLDCLKHLNLHIFFFMDKVAVAYLSLF